VLQKAIRLAARRRLSLKVRRCEARLLELARDEQPDTAPALEWVWDQMLYELTAEALGYSKNAVSMKSLAECIRLRTLQHPGDREDAEALLFGVAGLLPPLKSIGDPESRSVVRQYRARWKTLEHGYFGPRMSPADWLFFRLRPGNFPTARIAVLAALARTAFAGGGMKSIADIVSEPGLRMGERIERLTQRFRVEPGEFWKSHCHFQGDGEGTGSALGRTRIREILVNAVVPMLMAYACSTADTILKRNTVKVYASLGGSAGNSITRLMQAGLVKGRIDARSALSHQGMIELHQRSCSVGRCRECVISRWHNNGAGTEPG
jgi:hypothetical protein